jgi:hypothetical protein
MIAYFTECVEHFLGLMKIRTQILLVEGQGQASFNGEGGLLVAVLLQSSRALEHRKEKSLS